MTNGDAESLCRRGRRSLPGPNPACVKPLRSAVIGTGKISDEHLSFLRDSSLVEPVAVCDLSSALARYAAERFDATGFYTDYGRMLAETAPDVVHILTPPATHERMARDALRGGAHVVVEKPIALSREGFRRLWNFAREHERVLIENQNYRFNAPVAQLQRLVRAGALGDVGEVEVRLALAIRTPGGRYADEALPHPSHKLPAGVIHEFLSHLVYLTLLFVDLPDDVMVSWRNIGGGEVFKFDDLDALLISGATRSRIRFTCHAGPDAFTVTVRGSRGWAEAELFQPYVRTVMPRRGGDKLSGTVNLIVNGLGSTRAGASGFVGKVMQRTPYEGLQTFLRAVYEGLTTGSPMPISFEDMDQTQVVMEMLLDGRNQR